MGRGYVTGSTHSTTWTSDTTAGTSWAPHCPDRRPRETGSCRTVYHTESDQAHWRPGWKWPCLPNKCQFASRWLALLSDICFECNASHLTVSPAKLMHLVLTKGLVKLDMICSYLYRIHNDKMAVHIVCDCQCKQHRSYICILLLPLTTNKNIYL